jgi:hypothetical protein
MQLFSNLIVAYRYLSFASLPLSRILFNHTLHLADRIGCVQAKMIELSHNWREVNRKRHGAAIAERYQGREIVVRVGKGDAWVDIGKSRCTKRTLTSGAFRMPSSSQRISDWLSTE